MSLLGIRRIGMTRAYYAHTYLIPLASFLPVRFLRWLHLHWPIGYDPSDGWSYWLDASYARWCRYDKARKANDDL